MPQTIQPNATFRDGQRGELGAPDANGFASFVSVTGARFTVHTAECVRDDGRNYGKQGAALITGACALTIRAERSVVGVFLGLAVTRTPTAAQCNAKRNARTAAKLADVQRKEEQRA
jgi:hypothetical protein